MKGAFPIIPIIAVILLGVVLGVINIPALQTHAGIGLPIATTGVAAAVTCNEDGTNEQTVAVRNTLSTTSLDYNVNTVYAVADGVDSPVTSVATTGGSTLSYGSLSIPCPASIKGYLYAVGSATNNSAKVAYDVSKGNGAPVVIQSSDVSNITMTIRDSTLANLSAPGAGSSNTETTAVTMGASATRNGYLDAYATTGSASLGENELWWAIDTVDSSVFSDKAMSLSVASAPTGWYLTEMVCPSSLASFDSANRCYKSPRITSADGTIRLGFVLSSDLGNPGSSADPRVYVEDPQYFLDVD